MFFNVIGNFIRWNPRTNLFARRIRDEGLVLFSNKTLETKIGFDTLDMLMAGCLALRIIKEEQPGNLQLCADMSQKTGWQDLKVGGETSGQPHTTEQQRETHFVTIAATLKDFMAVLWAIGEVTKEFRF